VKHGNTLKKAAAFAVAMVAFSATGIVLASAAGVPEIDEANATIAVKAAPTFASTACTGEDGISYVTFRGTWKGVETEVTPGFTDYNLSGPLKVANVVWTINTQTLRGVLTGTATLYGSTAGTVKTYSGPLTLITEGIPNSAGTAVPARGWIKANTYTSGVLDGGSLLANVEFKILLGFAATGQFGDAPGSLGIADYSVTTANQAC
jgi:hypothetical protein